MGKKTLVTIVNHNLNDEAINLKNIFSEQFDTIIIDSGSKEQPNAFDVKLDNVGYSGLFNSAAESMLKNDYDWLLFICSDVVFKKSDVEKIKIAVETLPPDIGVYSPSSTGQSHKHCKNQKTNGMRDVVFVEGFIFAASRRIIEQVFPVNTDINKLGHGLDAYKGFLCIANNLRCVIDDTITVYHREGTGYNTTLASQQFLNWMTQPQMSAFSAFWSTYLYHGADSNETLKAFKR
jgi:hypothetical protein